MYRCDVCRCPAPPGQAKIVYKGVALCRACMDTVARLEADPSLLAPEPPSVAARVAAEIIASFEQREGCPDISWPR